MNDLKKVTAREAGKILKKDFDLKFVDSEPYNEKYKNFKFNILGLTGVNEIRLPQLRFKQTDTGKYTLINLYYNIDKEIFLARPVQEHLFTDMNGKEWNIRESEFFATNSRFRNEDGEYTIKETGEIITKLEYYSLPRSTDNDIETYAREYIQIIFADYFNECNFQISQEQLWDVRPHDREGFNFEKYNADQMRNIAKKINFFSTGRNISEVELPKGTPVKNQSTEKKGKSAGPSKPEDQDTY